MPSLVLFTAAFLALVQSVAAVGPAAVALGAAANYAILASSGVSSVPTSSITGDVGVSPFGGTSLTGFALTQFGPFSTSTQVFGELYAATYTNPTPANLATAVANELTAYNDAAGRINPNFLNLGAGGLGGLTLAPGLYKWTTGVNIATDVTIAGSPLDRWIFQISGSLTVAAAKRVILTQGALAQNIIWVVAGSVQIGPTAHFEGVILGKTAITVQTGASVNGRLLAQTFVALQKATVVEPSLGGIIIHL